MADMLRPHITEFDLDEVTPFKMLRAMAPELRGVVTNLHDALKELRSCVFRAGQLVLEDEQIAQQAWLGADVLARTLPTILQSGFMARDDDGALFSPHLYAKLLRKEERTARKAEADAQWAQWQDSGYMPEGMSRKMMTARQNGGAGGRPRKGESAEQARARRAREVEQQQAQRHMPLVATVAGGKTETENPNKKPNGFSVAENSVSSVSIDLELERDKYISSSSNSGETEKPKTKPDDALVRRVAARMVSVTDMNDQIGFAISFARKWLGMGATEETIISAIQKHQSVMPSTEPPRKLKVFEAAVLRGIEEQQVIASIPASTEAETNDPFTAQVKQKLHEAHVLWSGKYKLYRTIEKADEAFSAEADDYGLPPVTTPRREDAYAQYYRENPPVVEHVAA
ncbi:MAG: hypothetical protein ABF976_10375 [Acetobacter syzygii]|uniref:hypothetical protein n=2 Tax=Acetobacter TaxID=434 RepID=UPI0039E8BF3F